MAERELGKLERLCRERNERDLELARKGHPKGLWFDAPAGDYAVRWIEKFGRHHKGEWAGRHLLLEPWQQENISQIFGWKRADGTRRFRKAWWETPRKNGKALALDTRIPTPAGWSTMGDLKVGDALFDERGRPCTVTFATPVQLGRPCYRVTFSDGTSIVADADHLWYTEALRTGLRPGPGSSWQERHIRSTEQIRATLEVNSSRSRVEWNHRVPCAGALHLPEAPYELPPYTLGYWLGNGESMAAALWCDRRDAVEIVAAVRADGVTTGKVQRAAKGNAARFSIGVMTDRSRRSESIQTKLRTLGLLNNKHIPAAYLRGNFEQRIRLLQGLMDSDGSAFKSGQCEFSTTSPALRDGAIELLRSLGFKPSTIEVRAKVNGKDCGPAWRTQFWAFQGENVFSLGRKQVRLKPAPSNRTRSRRRQIIAVDPVASEPVRCIQVDSASSLYLAGEGMVPTHNTQIGGGIGLFLFVGDAEPGAEVYTTATKKDQALICHVASREMVRKSPELLKQVRVPKAKHANLTCDLLGSKMQALASDFGTLDGLSPHGDIRDEVHAWTDHELAGVLNTAMGSRRQPLTLEVTTAGTYDPQGVGWQHHDYATQILEGAFEDDRQFVYISAIDDNDDPWDPRTWAKANPNLGVSLKPDFIAEQAAEGQRSPNAANDFLRLHCNRWTSQVERWLNVERWRQCDQTPLDLEQLRTVACYGGLDLSRTTDLTAFVLIFVLPDGVLGLVPTFWLPESRIEEEAKKKGQRRYRDWADRGFIKVTPGDVVDYAFVRRDINEQGERFKIKEIGFDPYNATQLATELSSDGFTVVEVRQGPPSLSEACKLFEGRILERKVRCGGHPVMSWCVGNAVTRSDANGNIAPDKKRAKEKIDGVSATVTGLTRYVVAKADQEQAYTKDRGIRFL